MTPIATDPPVSEKQRRAMFAAAAGHSTLGIPRSVGEEFTSADPGGKLPAKARDMARTKWSELKRLLLEWIDEEVREPGTPLSVFSILSSPFYPAQRWSTALGTSGTPITAVGSPVQISLTHNQDKANCANNKDDWTCNAALLVTSVGTSGTSMTYLEVR